MDCPKDRNRRDYVQDNSCLNLVLKQEFKQAPKMGTKTHQFAVVVDQNGNVIDSEFAEGTNVKHTYICTTTTVENSKGTMLPSTGGEGTKMLLMIGFVTAMIFAVLLITHKKMTVYQD